MRKHERDFWQEYQGTLSRTVSNFGSTADTGTTSTPLPYEVPDTYTNLEVEELYHELDRLKAELARSIPLTPRAKEALRLYDAYRKIREQAEGEEDDLLARFLLVSLKERALEQME